VSSPQALEIGKEFDQEAIFWVQEGRLRVYSCRTLEGFDLGCFSERVAQGNKAAESSQGDPLKI